MPFDALTLQSVCDEIDACLRGAYVEKVVQTGQAEIGLECYTRPTSRPLLISAEPQRERVHLATRLPPRLDAPESPFLLLLRKHVRGSVLRQVEQPYLERILRLGFDRRSGEGGHRVWLIIEVMGRRSNVVLVDDQGVILDALQRVTALRNPPRPLLPHQHGSVDPLATDLSARLGERALGASARGLAAFLVANLRGCSPLVAREAACRALGSPDVPLESVRDWDQLASAVQSVYAGVATHTWQPTVASNEACVVAFAPYVLTHLVDVRVESVASPSAAVERGLGVPRLAQRAAVSGVGPLLQAVEARRRSVARRAETLRRALDGQPDPELLLRRGHALLASLGSIRPGQRAFTFDGMDYPLEADVLPLTQAQRLFRDYRKARQARATLPRLLEAAKQEHAHLEQLAALLEVARTPRAVRELRAELAADGLLGPQERQRQERRARKGQAPAFRPLREQLDGFEILAGASARGNELVTFRVARSADIWLHARGVPGAHVIIRSGGREPSSRILERAASLAAALSAAREAALVEVDWTERRHVRKVPGGPPGLVIYTEQRSLRVPPARELPL